MEPPAGKVEEASLEHHVDHVKEYLGEYVRVDATAADLLRKGRERSASDMTA